MIYDYLIIGAGVSGAAAAYELAPFGSVAIIEAESSAGYHSTGRSAALYTPNYGPELARRINRLSYGFLASPPTDFAAHPLLKRRGMLSVAPSGREEELASLIALGDANVEALDSGQTLALVPFLRAERVAGAAYEKDVADMDVDALHQGFLRGCRRRGATFVRGKSVTSLNKGHNGWQVLAGDQRLQARIIINAAGAWADEIGVLAGAASIELVPKRRTAILIDAPEGVDISTLPAIDFIGVGNYIKPDARQLMVSPGDATPVEPQDIQPDDMEVAVLVDWLETETCIEVRRLNHSWAGLRSFVNDGTPVVGFDTSVDDFFWLAGQGGYGIMMSSALARATAGLITQGGLPRDFIDAGIDEEALSVHRLLNH